MKRKYGFSLVEIAVVLVIISILITIVAVPLTTQMEQRRTEETQKQLETIKEALIGFALASGRLPCPATNASNGAEAFVPVTGTAGNGNCQQFVGLVPAATLGLSPVDSGGLVVDAWGLTQNRIAYGVSNRTITSVTTTCPTIVTNPVLTSTDGMRAATMGCLSDAVAMLTVCSTTPTGTAGAATSCSAALTIKAPFVLVSFGKNAATGGVGADEAHNVDTTDAFFVSHLPTQAGSASGEFDDIVTWGSLNTLFARMVQAGKLP